MLSRCLRFSKKRILCFVVIMACILGLQYYLTGSMVSKQKETIEAGNENSSVIGILDSTEIIRQKFCFDRNIVLSQFGISFGSFKEDECGTKVRIQIQDEDNTVVYDTTIPVKDIKQNAVYTIKMDHTVTIPKGVTCCLTLNGLDEDGSYGIIPTVNTTNRTDPNKIMSTLNMRTAKKCLNISYTYYYRLISPLIIFIIELIIIFILCFENITDKSKLYRNRYQAVLSKLSKKKKRKNKKVSFADKIYANAENPIKGFIKWCVAEPKVYRYFRRFIIAFNPFMLYMMLEILNGTFTKMYPNIWIFTWILLGSIQLILFAIIGKWKISMILMDILLFALGLVNFYIMIFRGTPFLPSDIFGVATATEVADHYTLTATPSQFVMVPALLLWLLLIFRLKEPKAKKGLKLTLIKRLVPVITGVCMISIIYFTPVLEACGVKDSVWNKVYSCKANGFYLNYFINLHYLRVATPSGYSQEKIADIIKSTEKKDQIAAPSNIKTPYKTNADFKTNTTLNGEKPNIILIMNESLADFSQIADVDYNIDPLEYIHSMKENTIYGKDFVSIFGAGTSNSEFEAMTGNTMTFFPSGCNVFQQFMHDSTFSLPSYLKSMGYATEAIHPSSGTNWNRIVSYKSMKFDKFTTIDDFVNPEYIRYISDKESYKKVIERFEAKEKGKPMYMFDLTIQNHGGYLTNTDWENPVYPVDDSHLVATKEYLSSTKVSDDAFRYLIDYFSKEKEPTVICMFGDHQPSIEDEYYEKMLGKPQSKWELEDIQKRFTTPFIIWANYDIEEAQDIVISNNYLENMLLKQAGLELPAYHQYIEKVSKTIPAMNVNGYMDTKGNWKKYDDNPSKEANKLINEYKLLQYGFYSDSDKNKMSKIFKMDK